jgi:hypothetical protein
MSENTLAISETSQNFSEVILLSKSLKNSGNKMRSPFRD